MLVIRERLYAHPVLVAVPQNCLEFCAVNVCVCLTYNRMLYVFFWVIPDV